MVGQDVFVYHFSDRFADPRPGVITGSYPDESLFDVEVFHRKSSPKSHTEPIERARFCRNPAEARAAFGAGAKYVCGPRDGRDPQPFSDPPATPEPVKTARGK